MRLFQWVVLPFQAWNQIQSTYKSLDDKVRLVSSLSWRSVGHGTVMGGVALYLFHQKKVPAYLPILCSAVALSILKQAWELARKKDEFSKREQALKADTEQLSKFVDEIGQLYQQFESSMKRYLEQAGDADKLMDQHDEAQNILKSVEDNLDKKIEVFRKRIEFLCELSEHSKSEQTVAGRLLAVHQANQRFLSISKTCAEREKESDRLKHLNDSLENSQKILSGTIERLSEKINQLKDQKTALKKENKE